MKYLCYDTALNEEYTLVQLMQRYPKHTNLFEGTDDAGIWDAAPWLFQLNSNPYELKGGQFIQLDHSIVFETNELLKTVLDYLHARIYVKESGQDKYLRIWDARVLLKRMPTWSKDELRDFFQVFDAFYTESDDDAYLNKWIWDGGRKIINEKILKTEALPVIKSEEELDREHEASLRSEKNSHNTKEAKGEEESAKEQAPKQQSEDEPPKRRKFFMD